MTSSLSQQKKPKIAVVGAGNWMLANDRIGPRIVEQITGRYGPEVELHEVGTTALALLDCIDHQDLMVIIDACVAGWEPGEVQVAEPDLEQALAGGETSSHQLGPLQSLAIAKHLFPERLPKRVIMILVETENLDEISEVRACTQVVSLLDRQVSERMAAPAASGVTNRDTEPQHNENRSGERAAESEPFGAPARGVGAGFK